LTENNDLCNEYLGNTTDHVFESLKSIRDRRIKDTNESPKFHSLSSKRSMQELSFAGSRGSGSINLGKLKIGSKSML